MAHDRIVQATDTEDAAHRITFGISSPILVPSILVPSVVYRRDLRVESIEGGDATPDGRNSIRRDAGYANVEEDLEVVAADRTQWQDVLALLSCGEGWMVEHYEAAQAAAGLNFRGDDRGEELRRGRGAWSCACASLVATPGHPVRDG